MSRPRFVAAGAGRMGRSIAIAFAYAGHRIALVDLQARAAGDGERLRHEAQAEIEASLAGLAELGTPAYLIPVVELSTRAGGRRRPRRCPEAAAPAEDASRRRDFR